MVNTANHDPTNADNCERSIRNNHPAREYLLHIQVGWDPNWCSVFNAILAGASVLPGAPFPEYPCPASIDTGVHPLGKETQTSS